MKLTPRSRRRSALAGAVIAGMLATACGSGSDSDDTSAPSTARPGQTGAEMGSEEALGSPGCDPATKRTSFFFVNGGPLCVNPWDTGDDNGGATAPGVTDTTVEVVVYVPNETMQEAMTSTGAVQAVTDQRTGKAASYADMIRDYDAAYRHAIEQLHSFQTWGRTPEFTVVEASGPDEASQRADAVRVLALEPFMVIDGSNLTTGAPFFAAAVANAEVVVLGYMDGNAAEQAPYRWGSQSPTAGTYLLASFLGQSLSGRPARYAGTELRAEERVFGIVHPADNWDDGLLEDLLDENGSTPMAVSLEADPDASDAQQAATTMVTKLKSGGVTSVVLHTGPTVVTALMAAAEAQGYEPEWIFTGFGFQDFDLFGRQNEADQMEHAFGMGILPPATAQPADGTPAPPAPDPFAWYWGDDQGVYGPPGLLWMTFVYGAIHYAGPDLNAETVRDGLFGVPAQGGADEGTTGFLTGYGRTTGLPYDEYAVLGADRNLMWWNPELEGGTQVIPSLVGTGKWTYLDGATRYRYGDFPTVEPTFFDPSDSVAEVPSTSAYPEGLSPELSPCEGCPSAGR